MEIAGYVDQLSVRPGDTLKVMVSTGSPKFSSQLVRLAHDDDGSPAVDGRETSVPSTLDGSRLGRDQPIVTGSYVLAVHEAPLELGADLLIHLFVQPTLVGPTDRTLIAGGVTASTGGCGYCPMAGWPSPS
ncbi:hypothetical protein E1212_04105 [Jiangella ureilytica]|uniref:Uncharacterized protein n=1 Tax=Jiangella ureilytica TaxID=2530374 RepID=A0A4R4RX72_9ACTN|nr:hypothetical protein [Jiangella ureilytica]TDC53979.1 hypothetical protein E1212_04105 [Jiangella ureilytica]